MITDSKTYHRLRAEQCRAMAESAADPDVRRRHRQLAELHSGAAEQGAPHPQVAA